MKQFLTRAQVAAADGFELAATVYDVPDSDTLVLVNSATAVPQTFYRHFASYLADQGLRTITFDYRGTGDSRPPSLRGFKALMRDWADLDMRAMLEWADETYSPGRLVGVGHSFGGQAAGMLDNGERYDGLVTMSAQSGYWRIQGGSEPLKVGLAVWVLIPLLTRLFGFFPWSRLGASEDLPRGVALEWAGWARNPLYLRGDPTLPLDRFNDFNAPVLAYSFDDDNWGRPEAVDAMMSAYPNLERRHVVPAKRGLSTLGHFGYFRPGREGLWDELVEWINALP